MEPPILANIMNWETDMDVESISGEMEANTLATGNTTRPTDTVDSYMEMEMFTKVNGLQTRLMERVNIPTTTVQHMKETGQRINNTGRASKNGLMAHTTKVSINMVSKMELESSIGPMVVSTMVTS